MSDAHPVAPERVVAKMLDTGEPVFFLDGTFRLGSAGVVTPERIQEADASGGLGWASETEHAWFRWLFFNAGVASPRTAAAESENAPLAYKTGSLLRTLRLGIQAYPLVAIGVAVLLQVVFRAWHWSVIGESSTDWGVPVGRFTDITLMALGYLPVLIASAVGVSMAAKSHAWRVTLLVIGYAAAVLSTAYWWWGGQFMKPLTMIIQGTPFKNRPPSTLLLITLPVLVVAVVSWVVAGGAKRRASRSVWAAVAGLAYLVGGIPDLVLGGIKVGTASFEAYLAAAVLVATLFALGAPSAKKRGGD